MLGAFSPMAVLAICDKPMVTKLSYAKSGKLGNSSGLMGCAVDPPRKF